MWQCTEINKWQRGWSGAKGYHTNDRKNNIKEVELVGFGDWRNSEWRKNRFKEAYNVSGLCYPVENVKVTRIENTEEWHVKIGEGIGTGRRRMTKRKISSIKDNNEFEIKPKGN